MSASESTARETGGRRFTGFLIAVSSVLALLVILLAIQNRQLKHQLAELAAGDSVVEPLRRGEVFDALVLVDDQGNRIPLTFDGGTPRTLLLIFSLGCPACTKTLPIWDEMLSEAVDPDIRVMGVQLDRGEEPGSLVAAALPFPVFGVDHSVSTSLSRVSHIPCTVLLDSHGRVSQAWIGTLSESQELEVREAISQS